MTGQCPRLRQSCSLGVLAASPQEACVWSGENGRILQVNIGNVVHVQLGVGIILVMETLIVDIARGSDVLLCGHLGARLGLVAAVPIAVQQTVGVVVRFIRRGTAVFGFLSQWEAQ